MTKEELQKRAEAWADKHAVIRTSPCDCLSDEFKRGIRNLAQSAYIDGILDFARLMMQTELDKVVNIINNLANEDEA